VFILLDVCKLLCIIILISHTVGIFDALNVWGIEVGGEVLNQSFCALSLSGEYCSKYASHVSYVVVNSYTMMLEHILLNTVRLTDKMLFVLLLAYTTGGIYRTQQTFKEENICCGFRDCVATRKKFLLLFLHIYKCFLQIAIFLCTHKSFPLKSFATYGMYFCTIQIIDLQSCVL